MEKVECVDDFMKMGLAANVMRGVVAMGYEKPSKIQQQAIPVLMQGKDMVGQASSGMGKTAAFTLPLLHTLVTADPLSDGVNGLVLLPTKNLAVQVAEAVRDLGRFIDGLQVVLLVGGGDIRTNLQELSSAYRQQKSMARRVRGGQGQSLAPLVVVGCPGRILDLCLPPKQDAKRRPAMDLSATRMVVLDEADELLVADAYAQGGSSSEQVQRLLCRNLPQDCAVALFTATLPAAALEVAEKLMRPEHVKLLAPCSSDDGAAASSVIPANISEYVVHIESPDRMDMWECKFDAFVELMETTSITQQQCIVFVNSNELADWIVGMFAKHEELQWLAEISTRELAAFRGTGSTKPAWGKASIAGSGKGKRLLITTDRDGRGIDVQGVRTVFNFELPRAHKPEGYVQRVGRCGRFGRQGVAVSLVNGSSADDRNALRTVCRLYRGGLEIPELPGDDKLRHVLGMAQAAKVKGQEQELEEDAVSVAFTEDTSSVSSASTCSDATVTVPADLVEQLQRLREQEQRLREQEQTLAKKQAELEAREQRLAEAEAQAQAQAQAVQWQGQQRMGEGQQQQKQGKQAAPKKVKLGSKPLTLLQLRSAKGRANRYVGHVKAVQPYGAFVRFGDQEHTAVRDGLLHVSGQASAELSARVKQLRAGEQVCVWVKQVYIGQGKIGLCLC